MPNPNGIPGNWTLTWSDEFNGPSLDLTKWRPNWLGGSDTQTTPPVNSSEKACYDPAQVSLGTNADGSTQLQLTAIANAQTINGTTYPYSSGMIQSYGKFSFTYGAFEARMWCPGGSGTTGMWPAFWTNGTNWPTTGEIDVLEAYGTDASCSYHYHYGNSSVNYGPGGNSTVTGSTTGWHTYGVNWEAGVITWYYDGVQVYQLTNANLVSGFSITSSPQYLVLNLAIQSSPASPMPATLLVDYVRVWTPTPTTPLYAYPASTPPTGVILPSGYLGGWVQSIAGNAGTGAKLLTTAAGSAQVDSGGLTFNGTLSTGGLWQFISAPLAAQTIAAGTWTFGFGRMAVGHGSNAYVAVMVFKGDGTGTRGTIITLSQISSYNYNPGVEDTAYGSLSGAAVTVVAGDVLVWEIGTYPDNATDTHHAYAGGTTAITADAVNTTSAKTVIIPVQTLLFGTANITFQAADGFPTVSTVRPLGMLPSGASMNLKDAVPVGLVPLSIFSNQDHLFLKPQFTSNGDAANATTPSAIDRLTPRVQIGWTATSQLLSILPLLTASRSTILPGPLLDPFALLSGAAVNGGAGATDAQGLVTSFGWTGLSTNVFITSVSQGVSLPLLLNTFMTGYRTPPLSFDRLAVIDTKTTESTPTAQDLLSQVTTLLLQLTYNFQWADTFPLFATARSLLAAAVHTAQFFTTTLTEQSHIPASTQITLPDLLVSQSAATRQEQEHILTRLQSVLESTVVPSMLLLSSQIATHIDLSLATDHGPYTTFLITGTVPTLHDLVTMGTRMQLFTPRAATDPMPVQDILAGTGQSHGAGNLQVHGVLDTSTATQLTAFLHELGLPVFFVPLQMMAHDMLATAASPLVLAHPTREDIQEITALVAWLLQLSQAAHLRFQDAGALDSAFSATDGLFWGTTEFSETSPRALDALAPHASIVWFPIGSGSRAVAQLLVLPGPIANLLVIRRLADMN